MLKVEGLNAGYGSVNILWDIGFEVKDGEIVAILGSNGAGKTTMVRTITGMVKASSGKVEFKRTSPAKAPALFWTAASCRCRKAVSSLPR